MSASLPPAGNEPVGEAPSRIFPSSSEERPAIARGASSMTEAPPADVFGPLSPSPAPAASGRRRQPVEAPEPVKLRAADLKMGWQWEDLSRAENMRIDLSHDDGQELEPEGIDAR